MIDYCVIVMPEAEKGLLEIAEYIALDNPTKALSFIDEISASLTKTLSVFPKSGRIYEAPSIDAEIRMFSYGNYNSYYQINEANQTVEILFIFNAKREMKNLMALKNHENQ